MAIKKEGGSQAAIEGVIFFVKRCVRLGCVHTYIKRHEWANRVIVAIPNKTLSQTQGTRDELTTVHTATAQGKSSASIEGQSQTKSEAVAKAKGKAKSKNQAALAQPVQESP